MADLEELDSIEILIIIDNELDPISPSPNPNIQQSGSLKDIGLNGPSVTGRGDGTKEIRMDHICCSAHGLSLMITGVKNKQRRTLLFDTGPEESAWERNAKRLGADIGKIELIHLSHWHRDHSGGMLKAIKMIEEARFKDPEKEAPEATYVDLHPARPDYRGMQPPAPPGGPELPVFSMEADPSFAEIEKAGGVVTKHAKSHTVLEGMFMVSGEIPRVTSYEKGLRFGVRYDAESGKWEEDTMIADERFVMCKVKDKGIVMFTGCSHAGVVNASKHAVDLARGPEGNFEEEGGGTSPLYAVMGGYHLADAEPAQIQSTVADLKDLDVKVLLAGHCTGWRAKYEIQKTMPDGTLVPSFVGSKFVL